PIASQRLTARSYHRTSTEAAGTLAPRHEDMLTRLGGQGRGALLNTSRLHTAGLIDRQTFLAVSSELMQHINTRGRAYGRLSYESASSVIADREPLVDRAEIGRAHV